MRSDKKLLFRIEGMSCAACSSRLERVLSKIPEAAAATVNLAANTAEITPRDDLDAAALVALADTVRARTAAAGFAAFDIRPDEDEAAQFAKNEQAAREHAVALRTRLYPEFIFSGLLVLVAMGHMLGMPLPALIDPSINPLNNGLVQLFLTLPVMFSGRDFYLKGFPALFRGAPNMDSLVAVGTGAAFVYSLAGVIGMSATPDPHTRMMLAMDLYFESVAVLISLISLGKYFEAASRLRTSDALGALMRLTPETALRLESETSSTAQEIPLADVHPGDVLQVRPGGRIPVDGVVISGLSAVDASMLTGESMPVDIGPGDAVTGGTLNTTGAFILRAERVGADTALARMARMVREAQGSKAPIARLADRVSLYFVPAVMTLATLSALGWYFLAHAPLSEALRVFVAVLVVACPCALGLATPMAIMVGTGRGAQKGVLVKNGTALEMSARIDTLVFDKTGTLTLGRPEIVAIDTFADFSENSALTLAASLEAVSEHPLAASVLRAAESRALSPAPVSEFLAVPGKGIQGLTDNTPVYLGSASFLRELGVHFPSNLDERLRFHADQGRTALLLAHGNTLIALLAAADAPRPEAAEVVRRLTDSGVRVLMLSGDNERTARAVAAGLGITEVIAGVLPDGKAQVIAQLQSEGRIVGMVGDGVNDAPALALADLGLVVSSGIDVAIEAGDIILLSSPNSPALYGVINALELGRSTLRTIHENLFWAFGYNVLLIPPAAGLLKLFGGPGLSPMLAGAAMALSSVSVVLNSLRKR